MKKIKSPAIYGFILTIALLWACTPNLTPEGVQTSIELKKLFADPPSEYRSAPLWDWNEQISKEGIDFQMKEFKKAGIGGVFVHPRPGLLTEYLSDDWFKLFDYTVQKGKELGLKVWIYDENSYPSGFAGGHVPAEMPDSYKHGTGLLLDTLQELNIAISDTICIVLKKTETGITDITKSLDQEKGKKGTYYVYRKTYPPKSPWYGGFSYVDLLYKGVTEKFMEITMTKGYERNKADFGKTLSGIFTDEPNLRATNGKGTMIRWTPDLWDVFQQRWGYDLRPNLLSLTDEVGDWKKIRHDYYETTLEMFVDRWAKPWSKYCDEKGLKWTGHYWEHGWPEPTDGFDESAFYIWHQQPGVDMLGNRLDSLGLGGQFGNDRAIRELRSAANQAGRTRTLSETYGGGGWNMNFETQKRLVDWECVMGVNFVNQHLSYYSLNGVRKFDYPPSFSYHEPWWEHYKLMGDYIGRVSMAMSAGQQINQTLVLQPNTSAWMYFTRKQKNPMMDVIRDKFKNFVYQLEQKHLEYDLGSENVLKVLGSANGKTLRVGKRDYSLVVIPAEMENIDQNTFELFEKYLAGGGKVLSFNRNISRCNGIESSKVKELAAKYPTQWILADKLNDAALKLLSRDAFTMTDQTHNGMLYHQRRMIDDGQLLFVVNSHQTKKAKAEITVEGKYVSKLDLVSGKVYAYPAKAENGKVSFQIDLDPVGSALFTVTNLKGNEPDYAPISGTETAIASTGALTVKRESDNILMVNYLDLKTAKSDQKDVYFMKALIGLFNENGVAMGNPWQHKIQYKKDYLALDTLFKAGSGFEANYHFQINPALSVANMKNIRAVVERPELWEVSINGKVVEKTAGAYWIEKSFPVFAVGEYLKPGINTLTLKAPRMNILAEVTPIYLLGDFLVKPAAKQGFEITEGNISTLGSWKDAGLPFYSQKVDYTQNFSVTKAAGTSFKVKLNQWNGTVSEVLVNGQSAGLIAFQPNELDVTDLLKDGTNEITVKVTGSLKNTFGFFYVKNDGWIFGPGSWNDAPEKSPAASAYFLIDYGLMQPFELVMTK